MSKKEREGSEGSDLGLGGIFRSLGGFLDLISDLAKKGEGEIKRSGEIGDDKKGVKAVYGFSVKIGSGGQPQVESFGNVKERADGPVVEEAREPMVDLFDERDHLLIVAELPGVEASDIKFEVREDILTLSAKHGERKYRKEVLLPAAVSEDRAVSSYRNGMLELKLPKQK